jgi:hypothetical protein
LDDVDPAAVESLAADGLVSIVGGRATLPN